MEDGREVLDDDVDEMGCSMMGGGSTSQSFPSLIPITSASQVRECPQKYVLYYTECIRDLDQGWAKYEPGAKMIIYKSLLTTFEVSNCLRQLVQLQKLARA